jgi:hypothetical protein
MLLIFKMSFKLISKKLRQQMSQVHLDVLCAHAPRWTKILLFNYFWHFKILFPVVGAHAPRWKVDFRILDSSSIIDTSIRKIARWAQVHLYLSTKGHFKYQTNYRNNHTCICMSMLYVVNVYWEKIFFSDLVKMKMLMFLELLFIK